MCFWCARAGLLGLDQLEQGGAVLLPGLALPPANPLRPAAPRLCSQCVDKSPAEAQRSSAASVIEVLKAMH